MEYRFYDKFEYTTIYIGGLSLESIVRKLNEYGDKGWEYIYEKDEHCVLKRKLIIYNDPA